MANVSNFDQMIVTLRRLIDEYRRGPAQPQAVSDPVEQVLRWAALRDQGLLTEEEFQHQKRKLLGL